MKKILLFLLMALLVAGTAFGATAYRYGDVVQTVRGDAIAGASATVYLANTTNLASLYSGVSDGFPALTNPVYSDSYGRFSFYATEGTYDIVIAGTNVTSYTIEDVRVFGAIAPWFDITDYGAIAGDGNDDTVGFEAAIDAAEAAGGEVKVPKGAFLAYDVDVDSSSITIVFDAGSTVTCDSLDAPAFDLGAVSDIVLRGDGKLIGPGKASADTNGVGILMTNADRVHIDGLEISGFYHGVRADSASTDNVFSNLYVHDMTHSGIWPHDGDLVIGNHIKDNGTLSTHHGVYIDDTITRGVRLANNFYEGISGSGVHINGPTKTMRNINCSGESMDDCGVGYTVSVGTGDNISITGAVIASSDSIDTDNTGWGIHFIAATSARGINVQANIRNTDRTGFNLNTANLSDSYFDVVVDGSGYRGVDMAADDVSGKFVINDSGAAGLYINGGLRNSLEVHARGNTASGVHLATASLRNSINLYSSANGLHGINFAAGADSNVVYGIASSNAGNDLNDGGTDNITAQYQQVDAWGTEQAYGAMYQHDSATNVTFGAANADSIIGGWTTGLVSGFTFGAASRALIPAVTGTYLVNWGISAQVAAGSPNFEFAISVNDVVNTSSSQHFEISATSADRTASGTAIVAVTAAQPIKLVVRNEDDTNTLVVNHANLTAYRIK